MMSANSMTARRSCTGARMPGRTGVHPALRSRRLRPTTRDVDETPFRFGLERVRELAPEARLGVLFESDIKEDPFAAARRLNATSIHIQKDLATRDFLDKAWEDGLDVHVWTINEIRDMEKFASLGVQGIVSDYPEKFSKLKFRPQS